jgi:ribonucleoside-diphosphate reductase beta chain
MSEYILEENVVYNPDEHSHFTKLWRSHESAHWHLDEINLEKDKKEWSSLDSSTQDFMINIFRLFTQIDMNIFGAYSDVYMQVIKNSKIRGMMSSFQAREVTHYEAYSKLVTELGMPKEVFTQFLEYKEMAAKNEYLTCYKKIDKDFDLRDVIDVYQNPESDKELKDEAAQAIITHYKEVLKSIAVFSAYTEGMHLFSSFVMLLNAIREGKFVGMGDVLRWSMQDEIMHYMGMGDVFQALIKELGDLGVVKNKREFLLQLEADVKEVAEHMVSLEDSFIDLCFDNFTHKSLTKEDMKEYTRYLCDRRTISLGFSPIYGIKNSPIPWVDSIINGLEHVNFFEARSTGYKKELHHGTAEDYELISKRFQGVL